MIRGLFILIFLLGLPSLTSLAEEEGAKVAGIETVHPEPYLPTDDIMRDVDATLWQAKENGKLAMFIMGANWCHDSIGLAHSFTHPDLAKIVADRYETLFVDVGFLDKSFEVIKRFGSPVIYGTPTVIIVDPETNRVLNRDDMHTFRDSYKKSLHELSGYFTKMAKPEAREAKEAPVEALSKLYAKIDAFEEQQAKRIYQGFDQVGGLLKSGERSEDAMKKWYALSKFRYAITEDLAKLRKQAHEAVMAGNSTFSLEFPEYEPFDWETGE